MNTTSGVVRAAPGSAVSERAERCTAVSPHGGGGTSWGGTLWNILLTMRPRQWSRTCSSS